jgi:hypothetical protein
MILQLSLTASRSDYVPGKSGRKFVFPLIRLRSDSGATAKGRIVTRRSSLQLPLAGGAGRRTPRHRPGKRDPFSSHPMPEQSWKASCASSRTSSLTAP